MIEKLSAGQEGDAGAANEIYAERSQGASEQESTHAKACAF
jgi:hypothetical protein